MGSCKCWITSPSRQSPTWTPVEEGYIFGSVPVLQKLLAHRKALNGSHSFKESLGPFVNQRTIIRVSTAHNGTCSAKDQQIRLYLITLYKCKNIIINSKRDLQFLILF